MTFLNIKVKTQLTESGGRDSNPRRQPWEVSYLILHKFYTFYKFPKMFNIKGF